MIEVIEHDKMNPNVKRVIVEIIPTELVLKDVVQNFSMMLRNKGIPRLHPYWVEQKHPINGKTFYGNVVTKETQWDFPQNN